jgi:GNAT superfamily N-acetyltransferase
MKLPGVAWRALTGYDMEAVEKIAEVVHPNLFEAPEVLAERQRLYHNGGYFLEVGERPAGYVLSHPWVLGDLPQLNTLLRALPAEADTYYIHDLALLPMARRIGAASFIVEALAKHARAHGLPTMSLVAVNGSRGFWERHEFLVADAPDLTQKLQSYDGSAQLMVRRL